MFLTEKRLIALSLGMAFEVETHLFHMKENYEERKGYIRECTSFTVRFIVSQRNAATHDPLRYFECYLEGGFCHISPIKRAR